MSEATQITIATGTTAYASDPDSDERIQAREVRVEITYRLGPGEDAALAASVKAEEVERTRRAIWESIRSLPSGGTEQDEGFNPADFGQEPPGDWDAPGSGYSYGSPCSCQSPDCDDPFPEEEDYVIRAEPPRAIETLPAVPEAASLPDPIEWLTKPQELAIRSHFHRLGISGDDQATLLRERFGKTPYQRLTKTEAAGLMRCLERGDLEPAGIALPADLIPPAYLGRQ